MILISACLCGIHCRYDGGGAADAGCMELLAAGLATPFCPEQLGGLPTPRAPVELLGGDGLAVLAGKARARTKTGEDVTAAFLQGAEEAVRLAQELYATRAILKDKSPSCGCGRLYDGSFSGTIIQGDGVCTARLRSAGVQVEAID